MTTAVAGREVGEFIPEFAYFWRPFAANNLIAKEVVAKEQRLYFIVDPWTQHWIVARTPALRLLRLSNGVRRLSEIVRELWCDSALDRPSEEGYVELAQFLGTQGMLFSCSEEHRAAGVPVYNLSSLTGIHLEITNACNMTCEHCYVASGRKLPGELTYEEILATIDMLPPFSGKRIAISGGEPAVHKRCADIIEHGIRRGHDVDLYTNGKKFPRKLAEHIKRLNDETTRVVRIQLSLEGASEETNDRVRGSGSFAATLKSLHMYRELGLNRHVVIFVCVTKYNIREVEDLIRLAEDFDVAMLVFSQWQKQGNASNTPWAEIAPTVEDWCEAGEKLLRYQHPRLQVFGNFYGDLNNNAYGRLSLDAPLFPKHKYFFNAFPRISPDGRVWADQLWVDHAWTLGNVKENDLGDCFQGPEFHRQLAKLRARHEIPQCKQCDWQALCEGGSAGHTYAEYDGDMMHPDLFCEARIRWFERYVEHQLEKSLGSSEFHVDFKRPHARRMARADSGNRSPLVVL